MFDGWFKFIYNSMGLCFIDLTRIIKKNRDLLYLNTKCIYELIVIKKNLTQNTNRRKIN
jgi:hypothetical protein